MVKGVFPLTVPDVGLAAIFAFTQGLRQWTAVDDGGKEIAKDWNKEDALSMTKENRVA